MPSPDFKTIRLAHPAPGVCRVTLAREKVRNAQDMQMTYELNAAFDQAIADEAVRVIILDADGPHFSAGHDMGGDGGKTWRDFPVVGTWGDFDAPGAEGLLAREREIYLDMTERMRNCSKPVIAAVQGWCIAGGLMLAWAADLIIAADDARFMDPVVNLGVAGVEYFAHPWEFGGRKAKELLFLAEPIGADEALRLGMANRVVPREKLADEVLDIAIRIAAKPSLALKLTKELVNAAEDAMGRVGVMRTAFQAHQLCHAHNKDLFGVIVDPRGLPEPLKSKVIERIRTEFDPARRDRALAALGLQP